ncbi:transposase [Streptomyces sp. WM6378]|uniref:transposase n=1 Tax=Streptomyces sp. WM6378 TaxID=1415557 RepID=UPI000A9A8583|nr:transposase [Streptomyces sp. WM6378]
MLWSPTVPASLLAVLGSLRGCFAAPVFRTFTALVVGLVAQTGRRTVTGLLTGVGLERAWPHDRAHSFFSRAAWDAELVGIVLSHVIARVLLPRGRRWSRRWTTPCSSGPGRRCSVRSGSTTAPRRDRVPLDTAPASWCSA